VSSPASTTALERLTRERSSLALRLASVRTKQHHKRASLELKVSSLQAWNQILRLGLTLLNHQNKSVPTTVTNKIVSFIGLPLIACLIPIYSEYHLETPLVETSPPLVASQRPGLSKSNPPALW